MVARAIAHAEPRRLTRREYDKLAELGFFQGERVELIHGIVVRISPIGPGHADLIDRLNELFVTALVGRARVRIQQPFIACDESEPEPDVAVVLLGPYAKAHPDRAHLLVEVAESSLAYDLETKAPLYASSDVPEYWIVDVASRAVDVHTAPERGRYTSITRFAIGETLRPQTFREVAISVAQLFD
jgi:Uma2 family endonuclease